MWSPVSSCGEPGCSRGVDVWIIIHEVIVFEQDQLMLVHHFPPQHHRQELIVGDVLDLSCIDVLHLLGGCQSMGCWGSNLENGLIAPVRVDLCNDLGHPVVLPHEQCVHHGQDLEVRLQQSGHNNWPTMFSLFLTSPARKQNTSLCGLRQPSSGSSSWRPAATCGQHYFGNLHLVA